MISLSLIAIIQFTVKNSSVITDVADMIVLAAYLAFLSFICFVYSSDPFIFPVQNVNITIQLLKQLDYQTMDQNLSESIQSKLMSWEKILYLNAFLFENPLTNFLLLKMLRVDLKPEMIPKHLNFKFRRTVRVPTKQHLRKSAVLINDMMEMYQLSAQKVSKSFTFSDCLRLAEELFDEGLVEATESWLIVAEENYEQFEDTHADSLKLIELKKEIKERRDDEGEMTRFEKLCAHSELTGNHEMFKNASTSCRYMQYGENRLVRMKIEEFSHEPIVQLIHDFLTTDEVQEVLKQSANLDFSAAPVVDNNNEDDDVDEYASGRLANSYYIKEKEDKIGGLAKKIKTRMSRLTGLNMDHSEDLEIIKYRPGGLHQPHVDQYKENDEEMSEYGNRYAQGLLFLSTTGLGGNFVMPELGIAVVPRPGSLMVWHNTDRSGNMDRRSLHGGCKVFVGRKIAGSIIALHLDQDKAMCQSNALMNTAYSRKNYNITAKENCLHAYYGKCNEE